VTEQDDRSLPRRLKPRERHGAIGQLDRDDPPADGALLMDPAILADAHPMDALTAT
jgi:hypothetical protein